MSTAKLKCRLDAVDPVMGAGEAGDVLAVGESITYAFTLGAPEVRRILVRARRADTHFKAEVVALSRAAEELGAKLMAAAYSVDEPDVGEPSSAPS